MQKHTIMLKKLILSSVWSAQHYTTLDCIFLHEKKDQIEKHHIVSRYYFIFSLFAEGVNSTNFNYQLILIFKKHFKP